MSFTSDGKTAEIGTCKVHGKGVYLNPTNGQCRICTRDTPSRSQQYLDACETSAARRRAVEDHQERARMREELGLEC